jgi:hypothetical protein
MIDHLQTLPGGLEVLSGPTGAGAARTVDAELSSCLAHLEDANAWNGYGQPDLILDCGRIQPGAPGQVAALRMAEIVILVARPEVDALASTRWLAERVSTTERPDTAREDGATFNHWAAHLLERPHSISSTVVAERPQPLATAGLVLVGEGSISPSQAALALGLRLLAVIPTDRVGASALGGEHVKHRRLARSPLVSSARTLATNVLRSGSSLNTTALPEDLAANSNGSSDNSDADIDEETLETPSKVSVPAEPRRRAVVRLSNWSVRSSGSRTSHAVTSRSTSAWRRSRSPG